VFQDFQKCFGANYAKEGWTLKPNYRAGNGDFSVVIDTLHPDGGKGQIDIHMVYAGKRDDHAVFNGSVNASGDFALEPTVTARYGGQWLDTVGNKATDAAVALDQRLKVVGHNFGDQAVKWLTRANVSDDSKAEGTGRVARVSHTADGLTVVAKVQRES